MLKGTLCVINLIENIEEVTKLANEEVEKIITKYSDDEKIEALRGIANSKYNLEIIKSVEDDNKKVEYMENPYVYLDEDRFFEIAETLKTDEAKLEVLRKVGSHRVNLLISLENDENKIDAMKRSYMNDSDQLSIIASLKSDDKKITFLDEIENKNDKIKIILSMQDDKKIEALNKLEESNSKVEVINSLRSDDKKIEALSQLEKDYDKVKVIRTLKDENKKIESIKSIKDDDYKLEVICEIEGDDKKIELLDMLEDEDVKAELIFELEDNDKKIEALDKLKNEENKARLISEMEEDCKVELLGKIKSEKNKAIVISSMEDDNKKMKLMEGIEEESNKVIIIQSLQNEEEIIENLEKIGIKQEKLNVLKNLYKKNKEVLAEINFEILDDKYMDTLGTDKVNLISNYPTIQEDILKLSEKEYEFFYKSIDSFTEKNSTDEWTILANRMLNALTGKEYEELINNIEDFDNANLEKIVKILENSNGNEFDIKSLEDVENYEEIKRKKCDEIFYDPKSTIQDKQYAAFMKIFGHNQVIASSTLIRFNNIDQLKNEELKDYAKSLEILLDANGELLEKIYEETNEIEMLVDQIAIEREFKSEYCKLYNEELFDPKKENALTKNELNDLGDGLGEELEGLNVYNAGTDFSMTITSVGAFSYVEQEGDYQENWNMASLGTQQFCASRIRNDMIGTAPRKNCCYGFLNMKSDSLVLAGPKDYYSTQEEFVIAARGIRNERYFPTNELINKTERYNEVDYRRIQGGEKKQPDYIVAFKIQGEIENIDEIKKAYSDWEGKLPIVIVDVDECLKQEAIKVAGMMKRLQTLENEEEIKILSQQIEQKMHNNQVTVDMNIPEGKSFKDMVEEVIKSEEYNIDSKETDNTVKEQDLQENFENVSAQERDSAMSQIKNRFLNIKNKIEKGEER